MERCGSSGYLELRQRLKESIRKQMRMATEQSSNSCEEENKRKFPYDDNYGSFFGHSQTLIAKRVIQDSKSLSSLHLVNKKNENRVSKSALPLSASEMKLKVQKIKESRDYSFLFSDEADLPPQAKEHQSSQARPASKQPLRRPMESANPRKQHGNDSVKKQPILITHSSMEQRKDNRGMPKTTQKMQVASSIVPHKSKPPTEVPRLQRPKKKRVRRPYEDEEEYKDENQRAISIIKEMFRYNPNNYADDDEDDTNMVVGFHDILKEERRSARIARKEDAEQLRLIKEEERERKGFVTKSKKLKLP